MSGFSLRDFLRPYFELVGIPAIPTEIVLFLGDYAKTPFGIHQDFHDTFVFVVAGRKKFRTWPGDFFDERRNITTSMSYEAFLDGATTLEGGPGDVLYWPSDRWHVGETARGFGISVSLAVTTGAGPSVAIGKRAWNELGGGLAATSRRGPIVRPGHLPTSASRVSRSVEAALDSFREVVERPTFTDAMKSEWLERVTGLGIEGTPPPLPWRTLNDGDLLRGDPDYPVVCVPAGDSRIICSANGHSFSIAAHPGMRKMVGVLNEGRARRVKDLIETYAGSATVGGVEIEALPEGVRDVLEKLTSIRALKIE